MQKVTRELSSPATDFLLGLKKLVKVVDPFARALMCLESTHSTIADNHIFWMGALSMVDEIFRTPDGPFSETEVQRLRGKINQRFDETINEPPDDVYILGSFGDPSKSIARTSLGISAEESFFAWVQICETSQSTRIQTHYDQLSP